MEIILYIRSWDINVFLSNLIAYPARTGFHQRWLISHSELVNAQRATLLHWSRFFFSCTHLFLMKPWGRQPPARPLQVPQHMRALGYRAAHRFTSAHKNFSLLCLVKEQKEQGNEERAQDILLINAACIIECRNNETAVGVSLISARDMVRWCIIKQNRKKKRVVRLRFSFSSASHQSFWGSAWLLLI